MRTLSCNCLLGKSSSSGKNGHMFNRNELLLLRYYHYPHFILAVKSVNTVTEFTYHQNIVNSALYTEKIKIIVSRYQPYEASCSYWTGIKSSLDRPQQITGTVLYPYKRKLLMSHTDFFLMSSRSLSSFSIFVINSLSSSRLVQIS